MPWSMGKDSNVLLWLALKAFFGQIPFPLLHIDTTYEFPEMLEFRDWAAAQYHIRLIVKINTEARARGIGYETHDPVTVTHELKTVALKQAIAEHGWDALITGIRRDEDPTRAKERYFSPRNSRLGVELQGSAAAILGAIRYGQRRGGTCAGAAAARLDRGRYLALHPAREDPNPEPLLCAGRKAFPLTGLPPHHAPGRRAMPRPSKESSPSWKPAARASAPAAPRITTNRTRCRSCGRGDSCETGERKPETGKETAMSDKAFRSAAEESEELRNVRIRFCDACVHLPFRYPVSEIRFWQTLRG